MPVAFQGQSVQIKAAVEPPITITFPRPVLNPNALGPEGNSAIECPSLGWDIEPAATQKSPFDVCSLATL
jgi:hypothetical protein